MSRSLTVAAGPAEATRASTEGRSVEAMVAADADAEGEIDATETMVLESALLAAAAEAEAAELAGAAMPSIIVGLRELQRRIRRSPCPLKPTMRGGFKKAKK